MRNLNKIIPILCLSAFLFGCAQKADKYSLNQSDVVKPVPNTLGINEIRFTALKDAASTLAAQSGLSWRSKQINSILESQTRQLDRIFNFNAMLLEKNVLPPILVEARDTLNLNDNDTIRLSDRDYKILSSARFVTAAPTWRDYLWMSYSKPEAPNATLLPKNDNEQKIWQRYIRIGWNEGVKQANEIFSANLALLHRDFEGMILYRKLYAQNIVSAPFVSQADLGITGDGNALHINDRVLRITAISQLNPDSKQWKPVLTENKKVNLSAESRFDKTPYKKDDCENNLKCLLEKTQE